MAATMKKFSELMRLARSHVMDRVPEQSRQSLPVPAVREGLVQIAFMFSPSQALPGVARMAPPDMIAWLNPLDGNLRSISRVTPADFGQSHSARDLLGEFRLQPGITAEFYLNLRERLFELYDTLVPAWAASKSLQATPALQAVAREFLQVFGQVSEPPLLPYYHALGRDYFETVRRISR